MKNDNYTQIFLETVKDEVDFYEVQKILKEYTQGNIWLIGGFVYRSIVKGLYGTSRPDIDLDFIIEKPEKDIIFPENWKEIKNNYGNTKFIRNDGLIVDFIPLDNVNSIIRRNLNSTVENFLTGTPMTIQSIAYDISRNIVIGPIGLKAIKDKTVAINNIEEAEIYARKKKKSIKEIMQQKAKELGFRVL